MCMVGPLTRVWNFEKRCSSEALLRLFLVLVPFSFGCWSLMERSGDFRRRLLERDTAAWNDTPTQEVSVRLRSRPSVGASSCVFWRLLQRGIGVNRVGYLMILATLVGSGRGVESM